ncbi:MAG: hypothetical protein AAGB34_11455, partial [Planctomycetota bacterium]
STLSSCFSLIRVAVRRTLSGVYERMCYTQGGLFAEARRLRHRSSVKNQRTNTVIASQDSIRSPLAPYG